jgi:hypothetical protein
MLHVVAEWADIVLPVIGLIATVLISFCILIIELILYKYKHRTIIACHKDRIMSTVK